MKKFWLLLRMNLVDALTYRGDLVLFTISGITHPLVTMFLWLAVGSNSPVSRSEIVAYFLLVLLISLLTSAWAGYFISSDIRKGDFSRYLLRPFPFISYQLANNLSEKFFKSLILLPVLLLIGVLLKPVFVFTLSSFLLFLIALLIAISLNFLFDITLGIAAFWLDDTSALFDLFGVFKFMLSGYVLPTWALPELVNRLNVFLPFRYILSFPIEILQNQLSPASVALGLVVAIIWLSLLIFCFQMLFKSGCIRYGAYGA